MNLELQVLPFFFTLLDFWVQLDIFYYFSTIFYIFLLVVIFGRLKIFGQPNMSGLKSLEISTQPFSSHSPLFFLISPARKPFSLFTSIFFLPYFAHSLPKIFSHLSPIPHLFIIFLSSFHQFHQNFCLSVKNL